MEYVVKFYQLFILIALFPVPLFIFLNYIQFAMAYGASKDECQAKKAKQLLTSYLKNHTLSGVSVVVYGTESTFLYYYWTFCFCWCSYIQ